jgi:hypothetical protein
MVSKGVVFLLRSIIGRFGICASKQNVALNSLLLFFSFLDKVTHPVVVPIEHLPSKLVGMDEKQTIAAVTAALVDLQGRIGKALQVIQSQHPAALLNGTAAVTGATTSGTGGREPAADGGVKSVESKPLVLSAASLGTSPSPSLPVECICCLSTYQTRVI